MSSHLIFQIIIVITMIIITMFFYDRKICFFNYDYICHNNYNFLFFVRARGECLCGLRCGCVVWCLSGCFVWFVVSVRGASNWKNFFAWGCAAFSPPPPLGGVVSMSGLSIVLGTNLCGKNKRVRNWILFCCGNSFFGARKGVPRQGPKKRKKKDWVGNQKQQVEGLNKV